MMIEVENLSKLYKLGSIGSTTLRESLNRAWYRMIGKEELGRRIGEKDLMIPPDHPQAGPEPNTFWALKDVSFTVEQGDIVGVIGRNGAGKSTLLKILTRITEPTSGRAVLRGRVGSLLEVGTGFHPELSGRENIFLNGAILGMRRREIERKFDEIVAFAEVERFIDTPVKRYSSGMYVRLAFAVAAHLDPEILLVDEVLAVGDAAFQKKCLGKMKDVAGEGRTVLFVSHNMGAVEALCSQAMLLTQGSSSGLGDCREVVARYLAESRKANSGEDVASSKPDGLQVAAKALDHSDKEASHLGVGEPLTISLRLSSVGRIHRPWIGLRIRTELGQLVFHAANREAGYELPAISGTATISCCFSDLHLLPGSYTVDALVCDHGGSLYEVYPSVTAFTVVGSDVLKSGWVLGPEYGLVFLPTSWKMETEAVSIEAEGR